MESFALVSPPTPFGSRKQLGQLVESRGESCKLPPGLDQELSKFDAIDVYQT